jgi:hypothetical protein
MPALLTLQVAQGAARDWILQIHNATPDGPPWSVDNPSPFRLTDLITTTLSAGQDQAPLLTLTPTWLDVVAATYTLSIDNAQSGAIVPSMYYATTAVARGGKSGEASRFRIQILSSAGTRLTGPVYCTFQQLVNYAAWIQDLQDTNDMAGFLGQRVRARSWLDDVLVSRYRPGGGYLLPGDPGSGAYYVGAGSLNTSTKWFRDILAANTGVDGGTALICHDQVIEIVCSYAIYLICRDEVSRRDDNPYIKLGSGFYRSASSMVKTLIAEVDTNADGIGEYMINCGATSLR